MQKNYPYELAILVCTLTSRSEGFLPRILHSLKTQSHGKPVQILYLGDNKSMTTGEKRNFLVSMSKARYSIFIDDDDTIVPDYVDTLLEACKFDKDCIVFDVAVTINGGNEKLAKYSIQYTNRDHDDWYERMPAHINAFKTDIMKTITFPHLTFREDYFWMLEILPKLKTEHYCKKVLYNYEYSHSTSESGNNQ